MQSLVYINHGRVIVDCPFGCGNAYIHKDGGTTMVCTGPGGCKYMFEVSAPSNLGELYQELAKRPLDKNRNWFPEGHPIAVRGGFAMGQSVADLAEEFTLGREGKLSDLWSGHLQ